MARSPLPAWWEWITASWGNPSRAFTIITSKGPLHYPCSHACIIGLLHWMHITWHSGWSGLFGPQFWTLTEKTIARIFKKSPRCLHCSLFIATIARISWDPLLLEILKVDAILPQLYIAWCPDEFMGQNCPRRDCYRNNVRNLAAVPFWPFW